MQMLIVVTLGATLLAGCGKKKEPPAVVEEVPPISGGYAEDTSVALPREPSLQAVGEPAAVPEPEPEPVASEAPSYQAEFSETGRFVVQVSVFRSRNQAEGFMTQLANMGFPAYVAQVENPTADLIGTYHRVRIGRFSTITAARGFGENTLVPMGYDYWVDNKSNDQVGSGYGGYSTDSYGGTGSSYSSDAGTGSYSTGSDSYGSTGTDSYSDPAGSGYGAVPAEPAPAQPSKPAGTASNPWDTPSEPAMDSWGSTAADTSTARDTSFNEGGFLDEW